MRSSRRRWSACKVLITMVVVPVAAGAAATMRRVEIHCREVIFGWVLQSVVKIVSYHWRRLRFFDSEMPVHIQTTAPTNSATEITVAGAVLFLFGYDFFICPHFSIFGTMKLFDSFFDRKILAHQSHRWSIRRGRRFLFWNNLASWT